MWVPQALASLFSVNKDIVDNLRIDLATARVKNEILERELTSLKLNGDWLRMQWNQLQFERTALIEKLYNIKLPAPELVRQPDKPPSMQDFNFDDLGDNTASKLGYQKYDTN